MTRSSEVPSTSSTDRQLSNRCDCDALLLLLLLALYPGRIHCRWGFFGLGCAFALFSCSNSLVVDLLGMLLGIVLEDPVLTGKVDGCRIFLYLLPVGFVPHVA